MYRSPSPTLDWAVLLHEVRDPGNAGTILRTADAAGADLVAFSAGSVDPYNGKCVRSTAGSLFHLPVATDVDPIAAIAAAPGGGCAGAGGQRIGDTPLPDDRPAACPPSGCSATRRTGWTRMSLAAADRTVSIPMAGRAESLNLASAAAICLFAARSPAAAESVAVHQGPPHPASCRLAAGGHVLQRGRHADGGVQCASRNGSTRHQQLRRPAASSVSGSGVSTSRPARCSSRGTALRSWRTDPRDWPADRRDAAARLRANVLLLEPRSASSRSRHNSGRDEPQPRVEPREQLGRPFVGLLPRLLQELPQHRDDRCGPGPHARPGGWEPGRSRCAGRRTAAR